MKQTFFATAAALALFCAPQAAHATVLAKATKALLRTQMRQDAKRAGAIQTGQSMRVAFGKGRSEGFDATATVYAKSNGIQRQYFGKVTPVMDAHFAIVRVQPRGAEVKAVRQGEWNPVYTIQ